MPRPAWLDVRNPADEFALAMLTGRHRDGSRAAMPVAPDLAHAASEGRVRILGTGVLSQALAGSMSVLVENNSADHLVTVVGISITSTVTAFGEVILNPTGGRPTTDRGAGLNALAGSTGANAARLLADTGTTLTGGADTNVVVGVGANSPRELDLPAPIILPPGVALGLTASLGAAYSLGVTVTVLEQPASY